MDRNEIKKYAKDLEEFHQNRTDEQKLDEEYYQDKFKVGITEPFHIIRTGSAARVVNAMTEHITTANPQVTRNPRKENDIARNSAEKISRLLNAWVHSLINQIEGAVRYAPLRGEGYFQIEYDADGTNPIRLTSPDPLNIYPDPEEMNGIPKAVVKSFETTAGVIKQAFPQWQYKDGTKSTDIVEYLAYWDKDTRYIEAADIPIIEQKNALGVTPIVHFFTGFGREGIDTKPEDRAVSRLRWVRGRLVEECEIESRIDSIIGLYANPILVRRQKEVNAAELGPTANQFILGPGSTIDLPYGWEYDIRFGIEGGANALMSMFQHLGSIRSAIGLEVPPIAMGIASGSRTSGRLEDKLGEMWTKKHQKLIQRVETALARALGLGLKILDTVPGALPIETVVIVTEAESTYKSEKVTKEDINGYYDCEVKLNPEEAIENDRNAMLYRTFRNEGHISWKTMLMKGLNLNEAEATEEINEALADKTMLEHPMIRQILAREAMEKTGRGDILAQIEEAEMGGQEQPQGQSQGQPQGGGGAPRSVNTQTPAATSAVRQMMGETPVGVRESPSG